MGSILTTTPSASAHSWTTQYAAAIEDVSPLLLNYNKLAMPTTKILLANAKEYEIGPDGKIGNYNFLHAMYSPHAMKSNQVFTYEDLDPVSRFEYTSKQWWCGAGISETDQVRYSRTNRSLVNIAQEKVQAIHNGLTWSFNYNLWSRWDETITNGTMDIYSALSGASFVRPNVTYKDMTNVADRIYSIPMCIRSHVTGHTFANLSSANEHWQSVITDLTGATVTRSTSGSNIDVVTNDSGVTVPLEVSDIEDHLGKMQQGANYTLYAACPRSLYKILTDSLLAERRRDVSQNNLDGELGISASVTWEAYNCTFYIEPMLDILYPASIFFYDPDYLFLVFDPYFNPRVRGWEEIPGTNQSGTVVYYDGQLCCTDRRATGAIHGGASQ